MIAIVRRALSERISSESLHRPGSVAVPDLAWIADPIPVSRADYRSALPPRWADDLVDGIVIWRLGILFI